MIHFNLIKCCIKAILYTNLSVWSTYSAQAHEKKTLQGKVKCGVKSSNRPGFYSLRLQFRLPSTTLNNLTLNTGPGLFSIHLFTHAAHVRLCLWSPPRSQSAPRVGPPCKGDFEELSDKRRWERTACEKQSSGFPMRRMWRLMTLIGLLSNPVAPQRHHDTETYLQPRPLKPCSAATPQRHHDTRCTFYRVS